MLVVFRSTVIDDTAALLIAVSSLTTGALLFVLANWKRGNVIQYVPFPVIGGFLAGTGLLLLEGALRVLTGVPLGAAMPGVLMRLPLLATVPALFVGVSLLVLTRITPGSRFVVVLPSVMTLGIAVFYIGLTLSGRSIEDAHQMGLLFHYKPMRRMPAQCRLRRRVAVRLHEFVVVARVLAHDDPAGPLHQKSDSPR